MTTARDVVAATDLTGLVYVITGATSGLGLETARALASAGGEVVLTGRDAQALADARSHVLGSAPNGAVTAVQLDLADLSSVRRAAAVIGESVPGIDALINNAGVMYTPYGQTRDGFELHFGTNHLGHFALTRALLPAVERRAGRVITLSSDAHRHADLDFDDPNWHTRSYDKFAAYGASKTANSLFAVGLGARSPVRSFAVHPGMVATNLSRHMVKGDMRKMMAIGIPAAESGDAPAEPQRSEDRSRWRVVEPEEGAATTVWAATADLDPAGGVYLADRAVGNPAPHAVDPDRADRLWELSQRLIDNP